MYCHKGKNRQIYNQMTLKNDNKKARPRNLKQVQNMAASYNADLTADKVRGSKHLADEMLTLVFPCCGKLFCANSFIFCWSYSERNG